MKSVSFETVFNTAYDGIEEISISENLTIIFVIDRNIYTVLSYNN